MEKTERHFLNLTLLWENEVKRDAEVILFSEMDRYFSLKRLGFGSVVGV